MRSQFAILLALLLGLACKGNSASTAISPVSLPEDAPDLSLRGVAFARLADGRVVARGTAKDLDYRRAGGRLIASGADATMVAEPGTGLASFGALHFTAPRIDGEVTARRGLASGGVKLETGRGDRAASESVAYDGENIRSAGKVVAQGPGYRVQGNGMVARADGSTVRLTSGVSGQLQMEARP